MRSLHKAVILFAAIVLPATAFALEGIGPRVTVQGTVEEIRISDKNKWDEYGGEIVLKAANGQYVTIVFQKDTKIITEGRTSRKSLLPTDVRLKARVRITGLRVDSKTIRASLFVITNVEINPVFAGNGTIDSIGATSVTVITPTGEKRTLNVTNETEINISYVIRGANGLSLIGKYVHFTINPDDASQVRILRIIGESAPTPTAKPSTVDLGRRIEEEKN